MNEDVAGIVLKMVWDKVNVFLVCILLRISDCVRWGVLFNCMLKNLHRHVHSYTLVEDSFLISRLVFSPHGCSWRIYSFLNMPSL